MRILGLHGPLTFADAPLEALDGWHDTAAVLLRDGEVVAALEEERLSRDKHTHAGPGRAVAACLALDGARLSDVDAVALAYPEPFLAAQLRAARIDMTPRAYVVTALAAHVGERLGEDRVEFLDHHTCHAWSAAAFSGWDDCLVMSLDGTDKQNHSGLVGHWREGDVHELRRLFTDAGGRSQSLGDLYLAGLAPLGYRIFDEYKVMGLAPHGDPRRYAHVFDELIELGPDGQFAVDLARLAPALGAFPWRQGGEFLPEHQDYAAALQRALERVAFHVVEYFARATGARRLALAGGVAHNCTLNGLLLRSGLFDDVWVQPAAHDAGLALGAAARVAHRRGARLRRARLDRVALGTAESPRRVARELARWQPLVRARKARDIVEQTAAFLADGGVVGWVQGRSEFGPRALGQRSILADPRPAANRSRINAMIKKREGYRPFAPSVLVEDLHAVFDVPQAVVELPFMTFVVPVRKERRAQLGAVTHVDGTARVQTVSTAQNERYAALLRAFKARTGLGVLLNTSFNNNAEPIVETCFDAVVTLLTTGLDALVIGDWWVERAPRWERHLDGLALAVPSHVGIVTTRHNDGAAWKEHTHLQLTPGPNRSRPKVPLSPALGAVVRATDGRTPLRALFDAAGVRGVQRRADVLRELRALWDMRLVVLGPPPVVRGDRVEPPAPPARARRQQAASSRRRGAARPGGTTGGRRKR
jgi:carbamoyltransferase